MSQCIGNGFAYKSTQGHPGTCRLQLPHLKCYTPSTLLTPGINTKIWQQRQDIWKYGTKRVKFELVKYENLWLYFIFRRFWGKKAWLKRFGMCWKKLPLEKKFESTSTMNLAQFLQSKSWPKLTFYMYLHFFNCLINVCKHSLSVYSEITMNQSLSNYKFDHFLMMFL